MTLHVRRFGDPAAPPIVCVAGFGDHAGMFDALGPTVLGERYSIVGVDLPGTGGTSALDEPLTLAVAAQLVAEAAHREGATTVVGHSVGSIVVSLAAGEPDTGIDTVLSLEGNLTVEDAYFSGSAAQYDSATEFHTAFLARLDGLAADSAVARRYRSQVATADPRSIWELGCDTAAWSRAHDPGLVLSSCAERVGYVYNADNLPDASLRWLADHELVAVQLDGASHWATVDQPVPLAGHLLALIEG